MDQQIFNEEQAHLTAVYGQLRRSEQELKEQIEELNRSAAEEKKDILTNLRYDVADDEVLLESYGEIETWNRYIDTYNIRSGALSDQLGKVEILLQSPYFARVTLRFEPEEEPEDYYIGRAAYTGRKRERLIIDWRSPIAETYYNQDNGATFYEVDGRRIAVDLCLRRQFDLKGGQLNAYFDTSLAIEDPLLLQSLSRSHSDRLQDITVTIQKEQNAVIRYREVPVMLVNGIAGSGKTSVLLQRIAYLFYKKRDTLQPENVVLMTLNPVFCQYIEEVLPDLGERNPQTMTWMEFLHSVHDPVNDPGLQTQDETLTLIDAALPGLRLEAGDLRPVEQKGQEILGRDRILEIIRRHDESIPTGERLVQVCAEELLEETRLVLRRRRRQWETQTSEKEISPEELLAENQPADQSGGQASKDRSLFTRAEENELQNNYGGAFQMIRGCGWLDLEHIGERLLGRRLTSVEWFYLKMALTGECDRTTEYVCVDEIQDYTQAQLMILARYYRKARFLLLGDEYQSIREGNLTFSGIHRLFERQGRSVTELSLNTSYRSTPEITSLFSGLLPGDRRLTAASVQREGTAPVICEISKEEDYRNTLRELTEDQEQEGMTAIVCSGKKSLRRVRGLLEAEETLPVVGGEIPLPKKGAFLITLSNAKGLEFDHVIIPDADAATYPQSEMSRHRLYTAVSRATQRVSILSFGEMTPLLKPER